MAFRDQFPETPDPGFMPTFPGFGSGEPAYQMAQARTKRIFGVPITPRRGRTFASGLAQGLSGITPGGGFGNFLAGFSGGLGGAVRGGSVYDEEQRRNAGQALDTQYKQAEIAHLTAMDQPKTPELADFEKRIKTLIALGLTPEEATNRVIPDQRQKEQDTEDYGVVPAGFEGPLAPGHVRAPAGVPLGGLKTYAEGLGRQAAQPEGGSASEVTMNPATMEMAAKVYLETGQLPPMGMGKVGAQYRTQILNRAAQLAGEGGGDVAGNVASYKAQSAALRQLQMTLEGSTAFAQTAHANGAILEETLKSIPEFGFRYGNKVSRWMASQSGSPEVARFHTALEVLTPEFGRILSQGNITGQMLTDTARKDMRAVLGGDFTTQQLRASLDLLYRDAANKQKSYTDQINAIRNQLKSKNFLNGSQDGQPHGGPTQADRDYIKSLGIK